MILSFFLLTLWALNKYQKTEEFWTKDANDDIAPMHRYAGISGFNSLARRHKQLSQLWFTISLAVFCAGLIYALYHVMEVPCEKVWSKSTDPDTNVSIAMQWSELIRHIGPNIFLYSIFFALYFWCKNNYRAHWHNFVTNEHRYVSLRALADIRSKAQAEIQKEIDRQSALVVLFPSDSAYLEKEGEKDVTAAERLLKIEESIRDLIAKEKP